MKAIKLKSHVLRGGGGQDQQFLYLLQIMWNMRMQCTSNSKRVIFNFMLKTGVKDISVTVTFLWVFPIKLDCKLCVCLLNNKCTVTFLLPKNFNNKQTELFVL